MSGKTIGIYAFAAFVAIIFLAAMLGGGSSISDNTSSNAGNQPAAVPPKASENCCGDVFIRGVSSDAPTRVWLVMSTGQQRADGSYDLKDAYEWEIGSGDSKSGYLLKCGNVLYAITKDASGQGIATTQLATPVCKTGFESDTGYRVHVDPSYQPIIRRA